jgi:hypothetical protein
VQIVVGREADRACTENVQVPMKKQVKVQGGFLSAWVFQMLRFMGGGRGPFRGK